ncbi:hypothetical protein MATL_G00003610 [Megalops atlanticus]|uniref:Ig-like domain-containing protein n=1 Tax=Megalops atlanticus TaxID=7932 RepID=A0A9D3TD55_MEGAT|nr:hypothetical protein MATL_G00003610 [Megalops atlanticus]
MQHCDAFDYWGKGTQVTVASGEPPSVFLLLPSCTASSSSSVTLGCLFQRSSPSSTFSWHQDGKQLSDKGTSYPNIFKNGAFVQTNIITLPRSSWKEDSEYFCKAGTDSSNMMKNKEKTSNKPCLEVTLKPPRVREMFINNQAVLDCDITGEEQAAVTAATVTWTVDGTVVNNGNTRTSIAKQDGHVYRKTSTVTLGQKDWFDGKQIQCSVQQSSDKPPINKAVRLEQKNKTPPTVLVLSPTQQQLSGKNDVMSGVPGDKHLSL